MTDVTSVRPDSSLPARDWPAVGATGTWLVVAGQELRDLWMSGKGLAMMFAYSVLLSVATYLVASNQELNFLEQREAVSLLLKITVTVGGLLVVLASSDAISGERERGTLESLLLTPVSRRSLLAGKGVAALSLWLVAFGLSVPYFWWIGRDVSTFGTAFAGSLLVGSLLALALTGMGLVVSTLTGTNGLSLALSFLVLLALAAPSQMPAESTRGWVGELLLRLDPIPAGLTYLERLIINGHTLTQDLNLLLFPLILAVAMPAVALAMGSRVTLMSRRGA
jgi:ABC-2 type transport system permease protein